jgi:hypothetical protein
MRLAPPISASDASGRRKRCVKRFVAMVFNSERLRNFCRINSPAMRSNTHASRCALWLSGSADLICGDRLDVIQITTACDAGYLAPRCERLNYLQ